jgi:hypothetical protein
MKKAIINIDQLKEYIDAAFYKDDELLRYYDKGECITTLGDACVNVFQKIKVNYPEANLIGITIKGLPVGYFAYCGSLLISFGLDVNSRTKDNLIDFWDNIKSTIGSNFQSILYSYNDRAISFLKRCGMDIIFDSVTILQHN